MLCSETLLMLMSPHYFLLKRRFKVTDYRCQSRHSHPVCGWGSVFRLDCVCELLQASVGVFNKSWAGFCQGNLREKTFDTTDRMLQRKPSNVSDKSRNKPKVKTFFFQKQTVCPSIMVKGDITQVLTVCSLNSLLFCFDLFLLTNEFANYEKLSLCWPSLLWP